jgi:hypothetical protein
MNAISTTILPNNIPIKYKPACQPIMIKIWNLHEKTYCIVFMNSITSECIGKPFIVKGAECCFGNMNLILIHPSVAKSYMDTDKIFGKNFNDFLVFKIR